MAGACSPVLITFAIPHESRDLRRRALRQNCRIIHTGIGFDSTAATLGRELANGRPEFVVSAGYAGGLDPKLRVPDIVADAQRSDARLLSRMPPTVRRATFLSVHSPLESAAEKEDAFRRTGSTAVDMETVPIAEACSKAGVPALFVRAISDAAGEGLPLPFSTTYDLPRQRPRPVAICFALLGSPSRIPRFVRFLRNLKAARAALTQILSGFLSTHERTT